MSNIKYVKKKEEKKINVINIAIILVIIVIVGALAIIVSKDKGNSANIGNHITEISYSEYKEKIKSSEYTIVLLASPTCSHCQDYKPFVNGVADEYGFEVSYLNVNSKDLTNKEYIELHDNVKATKDQFDQYGNPVIPTPTTIILKDGREVASILGDIGYNGLKDFLSKNGVIE